MFTWGPQQETSPPPPGVAPVASFVAMPTGAVAYAQTARFVGNGSSTNALPPASYAAVSDDQSTTWAAQAGASTDAHFQDFESYYGIASANDGGVARAGVNLTYTCAANSVQATLIATGANGGMLLRNEPPASNRNLFGLGDGRYSVAYRRFGGVATPANGGRVSLEAREVRITLSQPVAALSFNLTDAGDFNSTLNVKLKQAGVTLLDQNVSITSGPPANTIISTSLRDGGVGFVGFLANTQASLFDEAIVSAVGGTTDDWFTLDNLAFTLASEALRVRATVGQSIQFTDTSTEAPTSWLWDFGDGTTSTLQNPTKTYATPGFRTVTLTATNAAGFSTVTQTNFVQIT